MTVAAFAVLTLAIGATTAIFSVVDAVLLRGLPFDEQDRLVALGERSSVPWNRPSTAAIPTRSDGWRLRTIWTGPPSSECSSQWQPSAAAGSRFGGRRRTGIDRAAAGDRQASSMFLASTRPSAALSPRRTRSRAANASPCSATLPGDDCLAPIRRSVGRLVPLEDLEGGQAADESGGYEVFGVMPPWFAYPVASMRPTDIWIPYVVPAGPEDSRSAQTRHLSSGHCPAQTGRVG